MSHARGRVLSSVPLDRESFAPFGSVIETGVGMGASANQGTAVRFNRVAELASDRPEASANVAVFQSTPVPLPLTVRLLERHPHSTQMFVPMRCATFLVIVAPSRPDGLPVLEQLRVFRATSRQAINYRSGVWHHPIVALDEPAEFVMVAWEDGTARDCEEHPIEGGPTVVA